MIEARSIESRIVLFCRFNGVPAEERLHWRSFLVKLGAENLKGVKNEELLVACHKYVVSIQWFGYNCFSLL